MGLSQTEVDENNHLGSWQWREGVRDRFQDFGLHYVGFILVNVCSVSAGVSFLYTDVSHALRMVPGTW